MQTASDLLLYTIVNTIFNSVSQHYLIMCVIMTNEQHSRESFWLLNTLSYGARYFKVLYCRN